MSILYLSLGVISILLLCALVGLVGRDRNIGFCWAFLISLIFTPLIGLIITMLSPPKDHFASQSAGCLGVALGFIMTTAIAVTIIIALGLLFLI